MVEQLSRNMVEQLSRNWWALALRGVLAIVFGIIAFLWPNITVVSLVWLFGAYALADGILAIAAAWRASAGGQHWGELFVEGLLGIVVALIAFFRPDITALVAVYLVAAWAVITGVMEIVEAVRLRQVIDNEWTLGLMGVVSVLFGILLFYRPGAGVLAWVWVIAAYAILFGILLLVLAFRVRNLGHDITTHHQAQGV
jgi:uncharacterized membrane protein HdeD (DUF308 family)